MGSCGVPGGMGRTMMERSDSGLGMEGGVGGEERCGSSTVEGTVSGTGGGEGWSIVGNTSTRYCVTFGTSISAKRP